MMDPGTITVVAAVVALSVGQMALTLTLHGRTMDAVESLGSRLDHGMESVRGDVCGVSHRVDSLAARVGRLYERQPEGQPSSPA